MLENPPISRVSYRVITNFVSDKIPRTIAMLEKEKINKKVETIDEKSKEKIKTSNKKYATVVN